MGEDGEGYRTVCSREHRGNTALSGQTTRGSLILALQDTL